MTMIRGSKNLGWLFAAGCSALIFGAAPANAKGFSTEDLGSASTDATCVSRARQTFSAYRREVRAGQIASGRWSAALYNIHNHLYNAIITCNYGPRNQTRATLVVYSGVNSDNALRRAIADRITRLWKAR